MSDRAALQKTTVTCRTCDVTESFYSDLSVLQFKARHTGHEVVGAGPPKQPVPRQSVRKLERIVSPTPPQEGQPEAAAEDRIESSLEAAPAISLETASEEGAVKVSRVVVDLVDFPALPDPVFRIRGFKDGFEEAFVLTSPYYGTGRVRQVVEDGHYMDFGATGKLYTWEQYAVEYAEGVREKLGLPPEDKEEPASRLQREREKERPEEQDTVAATNRLILDVPKAVEPVQEPAPAPIVAEPVPAPSPKAAATTTQQEAESRQEMVEAGQPKPQKEKRPAAVTVVPSVIPPEEGEQETLLVSKSWYVQGGAKNRDEAVRVSKVLKSFRWRVEPVYTIGVILDDLLSIETSKNEVSRKLIEAVEGAGYRLSAVTVDQGKLSAWFKRNPEEAEPKEAEPSPGSTPAP